MQRKTKQNYTIPDSKSLYERIVKLMPYHYNGDNLEVRDALYRAWNEYKCLLNAYQGVEAQKADWNILKDNVGKTIEKIRSIFKHSYKGSPALAYKQLCSLLDRER